MEHYWEFVWSALLVIGVGAAALGYCYAMVVLMERENPVPGWVMMGVLVLAIVFGLPLVAGTYS